MTPTYLATLRERAETLERDDLAGLAMEVWKIVEELEGMGATMREELRTPIAGMIKNVIANRVGVYVDADTLSLAADAVLAIIPAPPPAPELPAEVVAAVKLAAWIDECRREWGSDIDGGDVQAKFEELGLIEPREVTAENIADCVDCAIGDTAYWPSDLLRALLERARSLP